MRILFCALAVAALSLAGATAASAQKSKKKDPLCGPNGMQLCIDRCNKAGGQSRQCPAYCSRQQVERCQ
jgi:hypothetical protein